MQGLAQYGYEKRESTHALRSYGKLEGPIYFFFLREGDNREKIRVERNKKNEGEKLTFVVYKPPTSIEIYEVGGCVRLCLIYINHTEIIGTLLDQLKINI